MTQFYFSMQEEAEVTIPLSLYTGSTDELRVQNTSALDTKLTNMDDEVAMVAIVDGPALNIKAMKEGMTEATITVGNGAVIDYTITVENIREGLRWIPTDLPATIVAPQDPPMPPDPFPPGSVDGPNPSDHGVPFFIQRDINSDWFAWYDIDENPDPDIRVPLADALEDEALSQAYRADIARRAADLGY